MQVSPDVDETCCNAFDMRVDARLQRARRRRRRLRDERGKERKKKNQNVPPRGRLIGGTTLFMR